MKYFENFDDKIYFAFDRCTSVTKHLSKMSSNWSDFKERMKERKKERKKERNHNRVTAHAFECHCK
jgi:hypothetical protein